MLFVPIGILIIVTNYFVDPANIFAGERYVGGIAEIMSRGHNVDNISNYDERLLQEYMIQRLPKIPEVVVLGSSRVMEIGSSFFPGKMVLNCGVSHGNIHDIISIVGVLDSLSRLPHELVIGLDQTLIGAGGTSEWETLYPYHRYLIAKLYGNGFYPDWDKQPSPFRRQSSLVSLNYFESSLQWILRRKSKKYKDVGLNRPESGGRYSDGAISYPESVTNPSRTKVDFVAKANGSELGLPEPDTAKLRLLERLLDYLQEKKVDVHLTMIPYHPEFYKAYLRSHGQIGEKWEPLFKGLAARYHISVSGSFDADRLGMPSFAFYDSYHCSGTSIKKYIPVL